MDTKKLGEILRIAYCEARALSRDGSKYHGPNRLADYHAARSKAWVAQLASALLLYENRGNQNGGKNGIRAFYQENVENGSDFGLNEFLHDICVAQTDTVRANIHETNLHTVRRILWQVESEFSSNSREAVKDFNKLVAGSGENKLFIGPYKGNTKQARSAASGYREVLRSVLAGVDQKCEQDWFLGIVPHPERWENKEVDQVTCWRFDSSEGAWKAS